MSLTACAVVVGMIAFAAIVVGRVLGLCAALLVEVLIPVLSPRPRHRAAPAMATGRGLPMLWMVRGRVPTLRQRPAESGQPVAA